MILTGSEIIKRVEAGEIEIDPFDQSMVNPNSVDLRLGNMLKVYELSPNDGIIRTVQRIDIKGEMIEDVQKIGLDPRDKNPQIFDLTIPPDGLLLRPGKLYLGHTIERAGSDFFASMLNGKSSYARLGLMVHLTGGFGDIGFKDQWTLELSCVHPLLVLPGMRIAQIAFYQVLGDRSMLYRGKYFNSRGVVESRAHLEFDKPPVGHPVADPAPAAEGEKPVPKAKTPAKRKRAAKKKK